MPVSERTQVAASGFSTVIMKRYKLSRFYLSICPDFENHAQVKLIENSFCVGVRKRTFTPNTTDPVAVVCSIQRERYRDLNIKIDESDNEDYYPAYYELYWSLIDPFSNFVSCALLAIAFYVYYLVMPIRQIEDDCLLNVAGSMSLSHAAFFYDSVTTAGVLPDLCITNRKLD